MPTTAGRPLLASDLLSGRCAILVGDSWREWRANAIRPVRVLRVNRSRYQVEWEGARGVRTAWRLGAIRDGLARYCGFREVDGLEDRATPVEPAEAIAYSDESAKVDERRPLEREADPMLRAAASFAAKALNGAQATLPELGGVSVDGFLEPVDVGELRAGLVLLTGELYRRGRAHSVECTRCGLPADDHDEMQTGHELELATT